MKPLTDTPPVTFHTRKQTATRLGLSLRTVDNLIATGKMPHYKIGGAVRLDPVEVDAALRARHHVAVQTLKGYAPKP